jgi:tetratricopeptide (TPR) repeat protein
MSENPIKLIRFWQELKRRKTGKVIVAYAATSFILLQLADILTPALLLPEWTTRLITLILIIGFPIAVIFSWVFDLTPEGIKKTESIEVSESKKIVTTPAKRIFRTSNIIIAALIIVVGILAYPKIFKRDTLERLRSSGERISVAVMPFQNMTNDTTKNFWQEMIQDNLINTLTNSEELKVRQTESIITLLQNNNVTNYALITPSIASSVSQKLDANIFVRGSINQTGTLIRLNAKLIDSKTEDIIKSFQKDGTEENILALTDTLSSMVKDFLIISKLKKRIGYETSKIVSTNDPEAYIYFMQGQKAFDKGDFITAENMFLNSIRIDSNFFAPIFFISIAYEKLDSIEQAKKYCQSAYKRRDMMPLRQEYYYKWLYARFFDTPNDEIIYLRQLMDFDDQLPFTYYEVGNGYSDFYNYEKAIPEYKKALEIFDKWDSKPRWITNYTNLGLAYHKTNQYKKEKKLYHKAEQDFPDHPDLINRQTILTLAEGKTKDANKYVEKYKSVLKENSASEATIATNLAGIYSEANLPDQAEVYYRQALLLEPENPIRMNRLAYFLIDKDSNKNEGLELVDKALELSPDNYSYLHTKGWGLYKQGKYQEALDILQRSWNLRRQNAVYNHEAFLHLEATKKAVAGLK